MAVYKAKLIAKTKIVDKVEMQVSCVSVKGTSLSLLNFSISIKNIKFPTKLKKVTT